MIVQELRLIQDRCGYLPDSEMRELAKRLQVPLHRIHEVASFYPMYRLKPPPAVDVKVCRDMACHINGAPALTRGLQATFANAIAAGTANVEGVSCLGQCDNPVACLIRYAHYY